MNYLQFQVSKNKFGIKHKEKFISIFSNYVLQHLLMVVESVPKKLGSQIRSLCSKTFFFSLIFLLLAYVNLALGSNIHHFILCQSLS